MISHIICFFLIAAIIIVFLCLAKFSNLLRDQIDDPAAFMASLPPKYQGKPYDKIPKPYSLARTQLAIWTTIIACVYVYLYFYLGCDAMTLNKTALILMGISVGTTAAGSIIDNNQAQTNAATNAVAAGTAAAAASTTTTTGAVVTTVPVQVRHQNAPSQGILMDLISDGDGVNIHRFQNVVWTVIAMVVYLYMAAHTQYSPTCGLPTLDDTLLAITGISNTTYVGLKINEN